MQREELLCQARMKLAEVTDLLRDAEEHELAAVAFELLSEVCVSSSWFTRSLGPVNQLAGER
jgi:hypothetical protein